MNSSLDLGKTAESDSGDDDVESKISKFDDERVLKKFLGDDSLNNETKANLE